MLTTIQDQSTTDLLNASQIMLAYPAFLAGYRTVQEALQDRLFNSYINAFLNASVESPDSVQGAEDNWALLTKLTSPAFDTELESLCRDGASKVPAFILPILLDRLEQGWDVSCLVFLLAAYGHYLHTGMDDTGEIYAVDEPHFSDGDWLWVNDLDTTACLAISPFASANLRAFPQLVAQYKTYRTQIACYGLAFSLKQALCAFWETQPAVLEKVEVVN